ncbi:MAG: prepilin peptidase [Alphaproteobacteria bacterium]|nr:prepilin peptidase [Alphaproteobacteria bacterium]
MELIGFIIYACLGLVFGSFSTALIYRVPRGKNWISERSKCCSCQVELGCIDLVPVFSWLLSGGKCRHCKTKISASYPVREILLLFLSLGVYFSYGLSIEGLLIAISLPFLFSLFFIDLEHKRLPDPLVAILFTIGLVRVFYLLSLGEDSLSLLAADFLGGAVLYAATFWVTGFVTSAVLKKKALGLGDVKFAASAGIWLGITNLAYFLVLSGLMGVIIGLIWKYFVKEVHFPFGPALILSFCFILLGQDNFF